MKRPYRVFLLVIIALVIGGGIGCQKLPQSDDQPDQRQKLGSKISTLRSGSARSKELLVKRIGECHEYRFRFRAAMLQCNESTEKLTAEFQTGKLSAEHAANRTIASAFQRWKEWANVEFDRASLQKRYDEINAVIASLETALSQLKRQEENAELKNIPYDSAEVDYLLAESETGSQTGLRPEDVIDRESVQKAMSSAAHAFSALPLPPYRKKKTEELPSFPEYKFPKDQETIVQSRLVTKLNAIVENAREKAAPLLSSGKGEEAFLVWKDAAAEQVRNLNAFPGNNESDKKWKETKLSELRKIDQETDSHRIAPWLDLFYSLTDQLKKSDESWDNLLLLLDELKERYPLPTLRANDKKFDQTVDELSQLLVLINNLNEVETRVLRDHFCNLFDLPFLVNGDELIGGKGGARKILTIKGINYTFCWCPAGTFMMGSPESEKGRFDWETQHEVTLTKGFWLLEHEVTQEMWKSVKGENPSEFKGDTLPVEQVSWDDCKEFIRKLQGEAPAGMEFRLPMEAEWEYACRAGTTTAFSFGNSLNGDKANCNGNYPYGTNTKGPYLIKTTPVMTYSPNPWGVYDMHGNVWEWCEDSVLVLKGAESGSFRVYRGGGWNYDAEGCRSADRLWSDPGLRSNGLGFRLALSSTR